MGLRTEEKQARLHHAAISGRQATPNTIHRFEAVVRFAGYSANPDDKHIPGECPLCATTIRKHPKPRPAQTGHSHTESTKAAN